MPWLLWDFMRLCEILWGMMLIDVVPNKNDSEIRLCNWMRSVESGLCVSTDKRVTLTTTRLWWASCLRPFAFKQWLVFYGFPKNIKRFKRFLPSPMQPFTYFPVHVFFYVVSFAFWRSMFALHNEIPPKNDNRFSWQEDVVHEGLTVWRLSNPNQLFHCSSDTGKSQETHRDQTAGRKFGTLA